MALTTLTRTDPVTFDTVGPLAAEELWCCREGIMLVTFEAVADNDQGQLLHYKDTLNIPSGKTVRFRALSPTAKLNREVL